MLDKAVAWAAESLDDTVVDVTELTGGLTSTMLALTGRSGRRSVLRLMTNEPWRSHGPELTRRERVALVELAGTAVPAPVSLGIDADGAAAGVSAHLMSLLPGSPTGSVDAAAVQTMAEMLAVVHDVRPSAPFRDYQSWAWEAKWVVPPWTRDAAAWNRAFELLATAPPAYEPTFLHRDFSHRNLLWSEGAIVGVVDWVETSTGPAWLDAAHAATNLAVAHGSEPASAFLASYGALTATAPDRYWLVMDAVGFLPPPGRPPLFGSPGELERLDGWLRHLMS